nr:MAG TPA: tail tape measure protein [Caudoviricetes sp.]
MAVKDLKASFRLDLTGNLFGKSQQLANRLSRMGQTGSRSMMMFSKSLTAVDNLSGHLSNRYAAIITGATTAFTIKNAAAMETRLEQLGIVADRSKVEMQQLNEQIYRVAQKRNINIDPSQLLSAVEQITAKTGELSVAEDNLENIAMVISATGAGGEDVGSLFSNIFEKFNVKDSKEMLEIIDALANQGKMGAFELRDLATQGERIISAYAAMGRTGKEAALEMGTMMQLARKGTGSTEQSATAFEAVVRNLTNPKLIKNLKSVGISVKDVNGNFRAMPDIIKDIVVKTNGDTTKLGLIFDEFAKRAVNPIAIAYNQARKEGKSTAEAFSAMNELMKVNSDGASIMSDSARMAATLESSITSLKTAWTGFANRNLAEPIQKLANALNRIQPEQLDKWLKTAGKIAVTVGALAVANKARHGILGIMDFFSAGKKGGTSSALGALAANGRPIPVYVVNGGALGAAGLADGMDMFGGGKSGKFGKVGRFLARHRGLAKAVQYGGKALKYGGKALGVAGMAYSAYELTQAQNSTQLGGSIGTIAGGLIGSIGGPLGMVAGAYIGNYLGEKIGGLFDKLPEENAKALESERALNVLKSQSDTKIHLDINSPGADVTLRKIEDNSPENNITRIDMSLGGRSYAP